MVMVISMLALVGWLAGLPVLTGAVGQFVPMNPAAALKYLLLGSALHVYVKWPSSRVVRAYILAAAANTILWGVTRLGKLAVSFLLGREVDLFGPHDAASYVPISWYSLNLISALGFVCSGLACCFYWCFAGRPRAAAWQKSCPCR
jgi:hypothetical protein